MARLCGRSIPPPTWLSCRLPRQPRPWCRAVSVDLLASDEDLERLRAFIRATRFAASAFPTPTSSSRARRASASSGPGCIAGFPIRPTRKTKILLLDLNTFEGDSGAPVYLVDDHRLVASKTQTGPGAVDPRTDGRTALPRRGVQDDLSDGQIPPSDGICDRSPRHGDQGSDRLAGRKAGSRVISNWVTRAGGGRFTSTFTAASRTRTKTPLRARKSRPPP